MIWLLVIIQLFTLTCCIDIFNEQDLLRIQQYVSNEATIDSLSVNSLQKDPNIQSSSNTQQLNSESNKNNNFDQRSSSTRNRKVYRIKNPFQNHVEENENQQQYSEQLDNNVGASNQYASMQYSLPPEEFLQKLRAENQQHQQTQVTTPIPNSGYTATPLPQPPYQYSTVSPLNYGKNNQQSNSIGLDLKSIHGSTYLSSPSSYHYSTTNPFINNIQSTSSPVPSFLSTPINNGQYSSQPSSYVSSISPAYLSSPSNQQSYVSSPFSIIQTSLPDYNRITTTLSNSQSNYDDYSSNRYSLNMQQFQNDYTTTTTTTPAPYSEQLRDSWLSDMNSGNNAESKSIQENVYNPYSNHLRQGNQQDLRLENNANNGNSDTHRVGSMAAANNLYYNYVQPDNNIFNNLKIHTRDLDSETSQTELYSNGDYGWRMTKPKPVTDTHNVHRYPSINSGSSESAVSHMNIHMDTGKPYNHDQISKSGTESLDAQEFAIAAARAHERYKQHQQQQQQQQQQQLQQQQQHQQQQQQLQQQQQHQLLQQQQQQLQQLYSNSNSYVNSNGGNSEVNTPGIPYYNFIDKQKNKNSDISFSNFYGNSQHELITASPYFLSTPKDNLDNKPKAPFDHEKALKNIVPIDVSNVVGNSDSSKATNSESTGRYISSDYGKDQFDQNIRQYIRPVTDSFYKDKNSIYGFNIKTKGDDYSSSDNYKQQDLFEKQHSQDSNNQGYSIKESSSNLGFLTQPSNNYQESQSANNVHLGLHRNQNQPQTDISSILKFSDIPYKLTQGLSNDALKLHNLNYDQGSIPTPLPLRINQNVGSHQLDVTTNLLNKLFFNKQQNIDTIRPEIESQTGSMLSTINGFKVANPFNVDLKLVAEMLKGKPTVDESHVISLRDLYTKPAPVKLDLSQLQLLLKNENNQNFSPINDGLSAFGSSYIDIYNNGRYPYQGVKYSRSQEEEESLPIAAASSTHPIGAVVEQDDAASEREVSAGDFTAQDEDTITGSLEETRTKTPFKSGSRLNGDRHRHQNILLSGRTTYQRKHPKSDSDAPYPLLKPPPYNSIRAGHIKMENKYNRRRRVHRPKYMRVLKSEALFEAGASSDGIDASVPRLLRPPAPVVEEKSDVINIEETS